MRGRKRRKEAVILLTTLKQELSGESAEENKKSQLTGVVAVLG